MHDDFTHTDLDTTTSTDPGGAAVVDPIEPSSLDRACGNCHYAVRTVGPLQLVVRTSAFRSTSRYECAACAKQAGDTNVANMPLSEMMQRVEKALTCEECGGVMMVKNVNVGRHRARIVLEDVTPERHCVCENGFAHVEAAS